MALINKGNRLNVFKRTQFNLQNGCLEKGKEKRKEMLNKSRENLERWIWREN